MLYTIWLYAIRRKTECNRFRKKMYVIRNLFRYVINPKERNIQRLRFDDIPFALQTDYIRLAAITYQSSDWIKIKHLFQQVLYFLSMDYKKDIFAVLAYDFELSHFLVKYRLRRSDVLLLRRKVM